MARYGFIHDKLDMKLLVLYIMSRVAAPIDFATLTDLAMCDEGVDYFQFTEVVAELTESEHLALADQHYAITEKGRNNGAICETSLPYVVRVKCDHNLARINATLRRNAQVRAETVPRADGAFTLRLALDDEMGNLLSLELMAASRAQAERMGEGFRTHPEEIYNAVLSVLLKEYEEK